MTTHKKDLANPAILTAFLVITMHILLYNENVVDYRLLVQRLTDNTGGCLCLTDNTGGCLFHKIFSGNYYET